QRLCHQSRVSPPRYMQESQQFGEKYPPPDDAGVTSRASSRAASSCRQSSDRYAALSVCHPYAGKTGAFSGNYFLTRGRHDGRVWSHLHRPGVSSVEFNLDRNLVIGCDFIDDPDNHVRKGRAPTLKVVTHELPIAQRLREPDVMPYGAVGDEGHRPVGIVG